MKPSAHMSTSPQNAQQALPTHIAVIMDGNGRWAQSRGLPRSTGHKKGADSLRSTMNACRDVGVRYLTIYAFSAENWKRPTDEISDLMSLLKHYLQNELDTLHQNGVRMRFIGDLSRLSADIREQAQEAMEMTKRNTAFNLTVALSYGARQEIARAMKKLAAQVKDGTLAVEDINEERIEAALDTAGLPEPDLLIRTGGEHRLSNFLLWQSAYTEFYFTPVLWPDFDKQHFTQAMQDYSQRERRYGTTS